MRILKYFIREFSKSPGFSVINLLGLVSGLLVFLVMIIIMRSEFSYDDQHKNKAAIYRIESVDKTATASSELAITAHELGPLLKDEYPHIENIVRFLHIGVVSVKPQSSGTQLSFFEDKFYRVDSTVFDVFSFDFVLGNARKSLAVTNSVVLTEKLARKYFGSPEAALNKFVMIDDGTQNTCLVTGVVKDLPENVHLKFDALIAGIPDRGFLNQDGSMNKGTLFALDYLYTYLLFNPNYNVSQFESDLLPFYSKYYREQEKINNSQSEMSHKITALTDVHFSSAKEFDLPHGNKLHLYGFIVAAWLTLLVTVINYVNLSSAKAVNKFKSIAVRKVYGANKGSLISLLISETVMLTLIAYLICLVLVYFIVSNKLIEEYFSIAFDSSYFYSPQFYLVGLALVLFVGIICGGYPSLFTIRHSNFNSLKSINVSSGISLRKWLLMLQFSISFTVSLLAFFFYSQFSFVNDKDLGFNASDVVVISLKSEEEKSKAHAFRNKILTFPGVKQACFASNVAGSTPSMDPIRKFGDANKNWTMISHIKVTREYFETMQIKVLQERKFVFNPSDGYIRNVMVNEEALRVLGITNPLDDRLEYGGAEGQEINIVGVVQDFHFKSLDHKIEPLIINVNENENRNLLVKAESGNNIRNTLNSQWTEFFRNEPFEISYYSDRVQNQYLADFSRVKLLLCFSALSIVIALIGFISMSAFSISTRAKQLMIRKVLGATNIDILQVLMKESVVISIFSAVLSIPLSYYFFNLWISNYVYRVSYNFISALAVILIFFMILAMLIMLLSRKIIDSNPSAVLKED